MDNKKLFFNEFDCDFKYGGYSSKEEYIKEMEDVINSDEFIDYNIYEMIFNNLGIDDKELIEYYWDLWKEAK